MKERCTTVTSLPKGHPDRNAIAEQIRQGRRYDMGREKWVDYRDGFTYRNAFQGLATTLSYVREYVDSKTVLDIGTGSSIGIFDIASSDIGKGLHFKATSLTHHPYVDNALGRKNITLTSVERLQKMQDESVGCILALHSLSYSARPELAVARINEVLVEGGIVKAVMEAEKSTVKLGEKTAEEFKVAFLNCGFEVAVRPVTRFVKASHKILLARKNFSAGNHDKHFVTPDTLLRADREDDVW